jgi:hypothetical protein
MTDDHIGPPGLEVGPRPGYHPRTEDTDPNTTSHREETVGCVHPSDSAQRVRCRCAFGEVCVCAFYADWTICWPPPRSVPEQLRARRAASYRLPRLACGRRDPISRAVGQ